MPVNMLIGILPKSMAPISPKRYYRARRRSSASFAAMVSRDSGRSTVQDSSSLFASGVTTRSSAATEVSPEI
jgi:hypothetical protein